MSNRILSYNRRYIDEILFLEFVTRLKLSYILTCWLYDRNYEYFKVASEGGQFVASVCENRWNRLSILQCHGDRSSTLRLIETNSLIFLMTAVPHFSMESFSTNSAHLVSRNWIWGVSFCPGQNFCRGRIFRI